MTVKVNAFKGDPALLVCGDFQFVEAKGRYSKQGRKLYAIPGGELWTELQVQHLADKRGWYFDRRLYFAPQKHNPREL